MATHKRRAEPDDRGARLRAELIDLARQRCERYRNVVDVDRAVFVSPWPRILEALEAGNPVELLAFVVPAWARGPAGPSGRVLVDRDGSVRPVGL